MKKLYTGFIFVFVICSYSNAQITFQKVFGDFNFEAGFCVRETMEGGYVVAGFKIQNGAADKDASLVKTDLNGDTIFVKTYGGTNDDYFNTVEQTADSGFILAGQTASFGAGNEDIYVVRTDKNGDTLWTRTYGGPDIYDEGYAVKQTTDGGFIILGNINNVGIGNQDVYLIKTNSNGDTLWTKIFGGTNDDFGYGIQQTTDGGYIIAGSNGSINLGFQKAYLLKTDSNGNILWSKAYGGTLDDMLNKVIQLPDNGYIAIGWTRSFGAGGYDAYLIRTDSSGNLLWSKTYGGNGNEIGNSFAKSTDGGYVIAGYTDSVGTFDDNIYLVKVDSGGALQWSQVISTPGLDQAQCIQFTRDNGYIISGLTFLFNGNPVYFTYLIKTDAGGNAGCNEYNVTTTVTAPATLVLNPGIVNSSGGIVNYTTSIIKKGTAVNTLCSSVSTPEILTPLSELTLSPNPATSQFAISSSQFAIKQVEIYNTLGEKMYSAAYCGPLTVNCELFPAGIYFVTETNAKGERATSKIAVVRE